MNLNSDRKRKSACCGVPTCVRADVVTAVAFAVVGGAHAVRLHAVETEVAVRLSGVPPAVLLGALRVVEPVEVVARRVWVLDRVVAAVRAGLALVGNAVGADV